MLNKLVMATNNANKLKEVKEILSSNKLLSNGRIEKIKKQIKSRIEYVNELKQARENDIDTKIE